MAHSNACPYPLRFPNEDQIMQISSYSSLSNALGTDPEHASRQGQRHRPAKCDTVTNTLAIYSDGPPVSNPSYPYPVRNVLNPGTYPARTPLSVANRRYSSSASIARDESSDQKGLTRFPSRYDRLPQQFFAESCQSGPELPTIHFQRNRGSEPYSLRDLLTMGTMPDLVTGDLPIFAESPDRMIKIKLNWPGYSRYPFEKRVPIKRGAPLTRTLLLMALAYHIEEFARWIQKERVIVEPGQERWAVTGVPNGAPAMWQDCVITGLQHRTGSTWQPEIFYLRGR